MEGILEIKIFELAEKFSIIKILKEGFGVEEGKARIGEVWLGWHLQDQNG